MRAIISVGEANPEAEELFAARPAADDARCAEIVLLAGKGAAPAVLLEGLKRSLRSLERRPPGKIIAVAAPELIEDAALALFAAVKSLARETALAPHCVNALWLKPGAVPGWRCLLYTSPSPRDRTRSRMPSSA